MSEFENAELRYAIGIQRAMTEYRDNAYLNLIKQINTRVQSELTDDMGSQFISNCGRDIAGEVVRNFFDTSSYYLTVDQLANRILKFDYENEYDPLAQNGGVGDIKKSVYNYNEVSSSTLDAISADLEKNQSQLFPEDRSTDSLDMKGKKDYRNSKIDENGDLYDEITGKKGTKTTIEQNGKTVSKSDIHADHIQSREAAKYNSKYITDEGVDKLKEHYNSADNMQLMHASANTSKGDVRVCEVNGEVVYSGGSEWRNMKDELDSSGNPTGNKINKNGEVVKDITYKATSEQLADATIQQWEKGDPNSPKIQKLIDEGYLQKDENGKITVSKSARKSLERNIRHSQNKESIVILKNTKYDEVAKDAFINTKSDIGKIMAGQLIYYAAPPIVYEIKTLLKDKKAGLDDTLERLKTSLKRVADYVASKMKDIFINILFNSMKNFIKTFMDILIKTVKATIQKILKIAKNLLLATVDAVRIIADKNTTRAEKADSVFKLYGVTVSSSVIAVLFEILKEHIPQGFNWMIDVLQVLATVICTNLTMLILEKADLFDVRFGFKMNKIKQIFEEEREAYERNIDNALKYTQARTEEIIEAAKKESIEIYNSLQELNPKTQSVRGQLEKINRMFSMNINFDSDWLEYIGMSAPLLKDNS